MRKKLPWFWIAVLLAFEVSAWIFDKIAITHSSGTGLEFYWSLISKPWIWFSLLPRPLLFLIWNYILSKADLSLVYPITSLSYPLTMLAVQLFFHESPNVLVWLGGLLVTFGVALLGFERGQPTADQNQS